MPCQEDLGHCHSRKVTELEAALRSEADQRLERARAEAESRHRREREQAEKKHQEDINVSSKCTGCIVYKYEGVWSFVAMATPLGPAEPVFTGSTT